MSQNLTDALMNSSTKWIHNSDNHIVTTILLTTMKMLHLRVHNSLFLRIWRKFHFFWRKRKKSTYPLFKESERAELPYGAHCVASAPLGESDKNTLCLKTARVGLPYGDSCGASPANTRSVRVGYLSCAASHVAPEGCSTLAITDKACFYFALLQQATNSIMYC